MPIQGSKSNQSSASIVDSGCAIVVSRLTEVNLSNKTCSVETVPDSASHRGSLEDFNVNFTTAAGTVRLVILDKQNNIIQDLLRDISSSTNGTGKTIIEEGQKMGIVGQTAGAGIFTVYVTGTLQKVR